MYRRGGERQAVTWLLEYSTVVWSRGRGGGGGDAGSNMEYSTAVECLGGLMGSPESLLSLLACGREAGHDSPSHP